MKFNQRTTKYDGDITLYDPFYDDIRNDTCAYDIMVRVHIENET